jgi:ribosome-associated protein
LGSDHSTGRGQSLRATRGGEAGRRRPKGDAIESTAIAQLAAGAAAAVKPSYLAVLDLRGLCGFTDHFVIVSAESVRQVRAIAERVEERLALAEVPMSHREGMTEAQWILLDYHDVVIHIFQDAVRQYYDLERLWGDAPKQQLIDEASPSASTGLPPAGRG